MQIKSIFLIGIIACMGIHAQSQTANITDPRLQISLPTVKGDSISLASLKGKVILVDFWASWCGYCKANNKDLVKTYSKYKDQGFEIYGISVDDDKQNWVKAIDKQKLTWLQVIDPRENGAESARKWAVSGLPATFLINKNGDVVAIDLDGKELDAEISRLLKE